MKAEANPSQRPRLADVAGKTALHPTVAGRVLMVEDCRTTAIFVKTVLRKLGASVDHVTNGLDALTAVNEYSYDLVLMDISTPLMDGLEATGVLRAERKLAATVPVVAMTAHTSEADRQLCVEAGMNDFLSKPFEMSELIVIAVRWLPPGERGKLAPRESKSPALFDDVKLADQWADLGSETHAEILQVFLDELAVRLCTIKDALSDKSFKSVRAEAHALKASAGNVGAYRLSDAAYRLEQASDIECEKQSGGGSVSLMKLANDTRVAIEQHLKRK